MRRIITRWSLRSATTLWLRRLGTIATRGFALTSAALGSIVRPPALRHARTESGCCT
jgi:hypothetical protein